MDEITRRRAVATIDRLIPQLLRSLADYESAKQRFDAITLGWQDKYGRVEGELHAANDRRRKLAIVDCSWYGDEIVRASAAVSALCDALRIEQSEREQVSAS